MIDSVRGHGAGVALLIAAIGSEVACDGENGEMRVVEVTVQYPIELLREQVSSVHFWVLEPRRSDVLAGGCGWLVAREIDPYDPGLRRHADFVATEPGATSASSGPVPQGFALVYAEAVDLYGSALLAGCAPLYRGEGTAFVAIDLVTPGTYDCSAHGVENMAPCDDGLYCTVGERCDDGECVRGAPRSCAHVTGICQVGKCDEEIGCHLEPKPYGTYCEDGDFCTLGDWCDGEACRTGDMVVDCSWAGYDCHRGVCDETFDMCVAVPDNTMECDDGLYCIVDETCQDGECLGTPVDCSWAGDACNYGFCNEMMQGACSRLPSGEGWPCDTNCTLGGTCEGGLCVGGTPTGISETEGPAGDPTCADFVDNDCDTYFDLDDPDCVP